MIYLVRAIAVLTRVIVEVERHAAALIQPKLLYADSSILRQSTRATSRPLRQLSLGRTLGRSTVDVRIMNFHDAIRRRQWLEPEFLV